MAAKIIYAKAKPDGAETAEDVKKLLEGTDEAWAQYKRGQGTLITSDDELDAFIASL